MTSDSPSKIIDAQNSTVATGDHHSLAFFKDSIHTIKLSALRFFSGTAISRVTGMFRDMALAWAFGTHEALAALFVAFRFSQVLRRIFGEGALSGAFIPVFEDLRKDSHERAFRFYRDLSTIITVFLTGFVIVSMIVLGLSLHYFPWSEKNYFIVMLLIIFMPSLIPICLYGVNSALLQCQKHYFTPAFAPTFFNLVILLGAWLLSSHQPQKAMPFLAIAMVLACGAQWLATLPASLKQLRAALKGKFFNSISLFSTDIRRFLGPLSLGLLGVGASQINNLVDTIFARIADLEGPALLQYGIRLTQLPLALFGIALSGALLPPLARSIQAGKKAEYLHFLDFAMRKVTAFLLPCSIILLTFGSHIVNLIFGRGCFTTSSVFMTTGCLHSYAIGLLPMGLIIVLAPACYAHKDFRTPTIGAILSLSTNLILDSFFVYVLHMGALSVALATSISAWINVFYIYHKLKARSGQVLSKEGKEQFGKVLLSSGAAGVFTWFLQTSYGTPALFFNFIQSSEIPNLFLDQVKAFSFSFTIYAVLLVTFAWLIKAQDFHSLAQKPEIADDEELAKGTAKIPAES